MWLDTHARTHALMTRLLAGVTDYLNTEISTSKQKKFSLVTFVDTPGLVDGDMKYPFDVNHSIEWLGKPPSVSYRLTSTTPSSGSVSHLQSRIV